MKEKRPNRRQEQNEAVLDSIINANVPPEEAKKVIFNLIDYNVTRNSQDIRMRLHSLLNELTGYKSMIPMECGRVVQKIRDILSDFENNNE